MPAMLLLSPVALPAARHFFSAGCSLALPLQPPSAAVAAEKRVCRRWAESLQQFLDRPMDTILNDLLLATR